MHKSNNFAKIQNLTIRACKDKNFQKELMSHPEEVLKREKIDIGNHKIKCYKNTKEDFHLIIPFEKIPKKVELHKLPKHAKFHELVRYVITMYQGSHKEKEEIKRDCKGYLQKLHVALPKDLKIHVHECTQGLTVFAIQRSLEESKNEELSEIELQAFAGGSGTPAIVNALGHGLEQGLTYAGENMGADE